MYRMLDGPPCRRFVLSGGWDVSRRVVSVVRNIEPNGARPSLSSAPAPRTTIAATTWSIRSCPASTPYPYSVLYRYSVIIEGWAGTGSTGQ